MTLQPLTRWIAAHWGSLLVLALATLITIPALWWIGYDFAHLDDAYIGDQGDTVLNAYNVYQALDNLLHRPTDPGYSTIFYGERASFGYTIAPYGLAVFVLPLYLLTGQNLVLTYNLYLLATFPLTAWAAYLLVAYLLDLTPRPPLPSSRRGGENRAQKVPSPRGGGRSDAARDYRGEVNIAVRIAAIVAGLMVGFAPFRFLHLFQPEMISTQFFLFALVAFHRLIDAACSAGSTARRRRWALTFAASFWIMALTSGYLAAIFAVIGVIVLLALLLRTDPPTAPAFWRWFALSAGIGTLLLIPFVGFRLANERFAEGWAYDVIRQYSAEPQHWLAGYSQIHFNIVPSAGEATLFLGFTPLILAGIAFWRRDRAGSSRWGRAFSGREIVTLYALVIVVGYVLTLGPALTIDGRTITATPFALLMQMPVFSGMRVPARFIVMPLTGTAILSAFALVWLLRSRRPILAWGGLLLIVAILGMEFVPYNGDNSRMLSRALYRRLNGEVRFLTPVVYADQPVYDWLADQPDGTAVLHIPFHSYTYYAYQPRHDQPMLNGAATYMPDWATDLDWTLFPTPETMQIVQDHAIRYVLVHDDLLSAAERATFDDQRAAWEADHGAWEDVGRFGAVDVYRLP